jgi:predicted TIM-barrel fold metal-dependent hydrolase
MPAVSDRIERAVTDPRELLANRVALGRIDAKDFCNGIGDRACFAPVLDACAAVHLPVCLDFRRQGDFLSFDFGICERYPAIPFVIEGFGGYPMHRILWCMREYPNLHLSTVGYQPFDGVKFMCQEVGADRMIYGSDWPASAAGMAQGSVLLAGISQAERQAIAGGNFLRLLSGIAPAPKG